MIHENSPDTVWERHYLLYFPDWQNLIGPFPKTSKPSRPGRQYSQHMLFLLWLLGLESAKTGSAGCTLGKYLRRCEAYCEQVVDTELRSSGLGPWLVVEGRWQGTECKEEVAQELYRRWHDGQFSGEAPELSVWTHNTEEKAIQFVQVLFAYIMYMRI